MPQFDGSYIRKTGLRREYAYKLTYGMRGRILSWMAVVHHGHAVKGHPSGEFAFELPPPEKEQRRIAQELAQASIESLTNVQE